MYNAFNPIDISYAAFLADDEKARQRAIRRARAYASGRQFIALTDRLRSFLADPLSGKRTSFDDSDLLRLNICHTINRAVTERLIIRTFDSGNEPLSLWASSVWQRNRMDARADDVHDITIRDGESFVLVTWDNASALPRFTPHPRYVEAADSVELEDDGYGIKAFYQDDDDTGVMLYAVKRWTQVDYTTDGRGGISRNARQRATFYYPDRAEKYELVSGLTLKPVTDGVEPWPLPWVDSTGAPLGIPVIHFKNPHLSAEAWEAIPVQNAINKTLVDLLASSDLTAFRILIALGFEPFDENGVPWAIEPGQWVGTTSTEAHVQVVDGADLTNQLELLDSLILKAAQVTDTPPSRFIVSKAVAGVETQKQQETPLLAKIRKRHVLIGNAWEDCFYLARRLENTFGPQTLDETALLTAVWEPASVRDEDAELVRAEAKMRLGIPTEQLWSELGYDEGQIARFIEMKQQTEAQAAPQAQAVMPIDNGTQDTSQGQ